MKKFILAAFLILGLLASGCGGAPTEKKADEKLTVVVSFNAMKEFTQAVGGDAIHVVSLIPEGTEPHGFSPTADQMKTLHNAKLLIVHGLGMEPWAQKIAETSGNPNLIVVEASKGVTPIPLEEEDEDNHGAEEKEHHHHGPYDPHAWLSLTAAQIEVQNIADALSQADPVHKETYKKNAASYKKQLQSLYQEYQPRFEKIGHKDFVAGHAAFGYLCRDFGLHMDSIESVFAEREPSAKQMARLLDYCRARGIKTIFTESEVSPKTSETLAREIGAKTVPIYTMETSENGKGYLERMKENLAHIEESLR